MKIIRNGHEFTLTAQELDAVYWEVEKTCKQEDINYLLRERESSLVDADNYEEILNEIYEIYDHNRSWGIADIDCLTSSIQEYEARQ